MARLIFRNGPYAGKALTLPEGKTITIGRNRDLELPLPDLRLSRRHCQVEPVGDGFVVRDLASTNGSFLNGQRVETDMPLNHLDVILIGDTEIEFQMPEKIDQGQTRIGPAATPKARTPAIPVRVSPALEPATGTSATSPVSAPAQIPSGELPAAPGTGAMAPVAAPARIPSGELPAGPGGSTAPPVSAPAPMPPVAAPAPVPVPDVAQQQQDPLAVAIAELDLPLPAVPAIELPARPQVVFCDQCNGSIPIVHVDLCIAKEIDEKMYCRECMAKGVPGGKPGAWPPPDHWGKQASDKDLDDILKGLDQVEEISFDDNALRQAAAKAPPGHTSRHSPVTGPPKTESAFDRLLEEEPQRPKPKSKSKAPKPDELFGDEFEEIG